MARFQTSRASSSQTLPRPALSSGFPSAGYNRAGGGKGGLSVKAHTPASLSLTLTPLSCRRLRG